MGASGELEIARPSVKPDLSATISCIDLQASFDLRSGFTVAPLRMRRDC
jgi:hypothetical protein